MIVCLTACTTVKPIKKEENSSILETKYELDYQDQYYNSYFYQADDDTIYFNDSNIIYKEVNNQITPVYNFFEQHQVYATQSFCCGYKDYIYIQ